MLERPNRIPWLGALAIVALVLAGCAQGMRYEIGREAQVSALENALVAGESTEQDVRSALGAPDGVGRYVSPVAREPRTMWVYFHEAGTMQRAERTMLFVLLKDRKFDGYLWYSSDLTSGS